MMAKNPHCHWCGVRVIEYSLTYTPGERRPDDMATIDHTISRYFRRKGSHVRKVLSCHKCNNNRAKEELEILKSGNF